MIFPFGKYSGCGNDFVIMDDRALIFPIDDKAQIQYICHRKIGVGADGLILLQKSECASFRMRIFNADGSEAEMCGNGIRALMRFIADSGFTSQQNTIETMAGVLKVSFVGDNISVMMSTPKNVQWNLQVDIEGNAFEVHFLDTGVPHVVHFTDDIENFDVHGIGKKFRSHVDFGSQGTNFNVVHFDGQRLYNRTYERGVEAETLACGTGCVAAALAAHKCFNLPSPIKVMTRSKDELDISFDSQAAGISNVCMTGPAHKIFEGSIVIRLADSHAYSMKAPGFSGLQFAQCN